MKKMALLLAALLLLSSLAGCGKSSKGEASVESVSMICGLSGVGQVDRFAGVVSAQGETKIAKDENRQVASVAVKAGDEVKKGQTLFTYDQTQAQLDLEKAQLELDQMKSTLSAKQEEKARLERDKSNVSPDQQLQYDLEIREATAAILEQQYNISLKEKEVQQIPFIVVRSDMSAPYTRPVLPRTSSAISGFFFCGMILLPVLYASSISTNLYSLEFQMMISSEKRLKCIIMVAMADRYSIR